MPKVLKYVGKGAWLEVEDSEITIQDRTRLLGRIRHNAASRLECFFEELFGNIYNSGYRSIKLSVLLEKFGIGRRSANSLQKIREQFKARGIYSLPELSNELKLDASIRLYNYPVKQLGETFGTERELEDYVHRHGHYNKLGIRAVVRQYSPKGTKDKLDFKGELESGDIAVVELKNYGGGKSAVEQVLRYAGLLRMEYHGKSIRQILVTGVQNYETALAIRGMQKEQRDNFEWYLYKYHMADNLFEFVRVTDEDIDFQATKLV